MFKPMLSARDVPIALIQYPKLASSKLDGIRAIIHPEIGLITRHLKLVRNFQLNEYFKPLVEKCKNEKIILDGEFFMKGLTFQEITSAVMTENYILKGINHDLMQKLLSIEYHVFDCLSMNERFEKFTDRIARLKYFHANEIEKEFSRCKILEQVLVKNQAEFIKFYEDNLENNFEGAILRNPNSEYKFGRSTARSQDMIKYKPFLTFEGVIIGVERATVVNPLVAKTRNELGRSVTSKKKADRIPVEMVSAVKVMFNHHIVRVSMTGDYEFRRKIWREQGDYIGKTIEYKGMLVGSKDVPRHPTFIRFRPDRD